MNPNVNNNNPSFPSFSSNEPNSFDPIGASVNKSPPEKTLQKPKSQATTTTTSPLTFPNLADFTPRTIRSISTIWDSGAIPDRVRRMSSTITPQIEETRVVLGLTSKLLRFLGFSFKWVYMLISLLLFAIPLSYQWFQMGRYYLFNPAITRNIQYGPAKRNYLDIYLPQSLANASPSDRRKKKYPVFVFFTGGAWIIGYKAWGSLFGKILAKMDIMVVTPDYRNFPQVYIIYFLYICVIAFRDFDIYLL